MDIEVDALGRFEMALREAFGARLDGVHELDREGHEILVAVVLADTASGYDTLRAVDISYDVIRNTGIAITPDIVSRSVWLSIRPHWFKDVETRRLAVLQDFFEACVEHGISPDHSVRILMQEWATRIRYTREQERVPEPPSGMELAAHGQHPHSALREAARRQAFEPHPRRSESVGTHETA